MRRLRPVILLAFTLVCVACYSDPVLQFTTSSLPVSLETSLSIDPSAASYRFLLNRNLVAGAEDAIVVGASGAFSALAVTLNDGTPAGSVEVDTTSQAGFFASPEPGRFLFTIPPGTSLRQVRVDVTDPVEDFSIGSIGMAKRSYGIQVLDRLVLDSGVRYEKLVDPGEADISFETHVVDFTGLGDGLLDEGFSGVEITYDYDPDVAGEASGSSLVRLFVYGTAGERVEYRLNPQPGGGSVYVYRGSAGFLPARLELESANQRFRFAGSRLVRLPEQSAIPIDADFATIVAYSRDGWRRDEYELFRWTRYPNVLVFDTRDYAFQSKMFLRLAYFVEKPGFAGNVMSDAELAGRHGWNAHDYRPVDLAAFFSAAADSQLNRYEIELRDILVHERIILPTAGRYAPGSGGIISISQESYLYLRNLFMVHEGCHGIFFADEGFRDVVFDLWASLEDEERAFWRLFLGNRDYNTHDEYLMVNEFQAYLLQQPLDRNDAYFRGWAVPQFKLDMPEYFEYADRFMREYPDSFFRSAKALSEATWPGARVDLRTLYCLERVALAQ